MLIDRDTFLPFDADLPEQNKGKVACIGSGPASLACAAGLRLKGYDVSIFEALPKAGGSLTYLVPEYKLPQQSVDEQIELLKQSGIKIFVNTPFCTSFNAKKLEKMGVKAYTGLNVSKQDAISSIEKLGEIQYWANELDLTGAAAYYMLNNKVDGIIALSAFGCGPDSLMVDEIQYHASEKGLPMMHLTIDEHTGEAGFITRVEAFVDMLIRRKRKILKDNNNIKRLPSSKKEKVIVSEEVVKNLTFV